MSPAPPVDHAALRPRKVFLVARREILIRFRSRVFPVTTVVMAVLVAGGILLASYLSAETPSQPEAVPVGFSDGSQALEPYFKSIAVALGETVAVTDVADADSGRAQVEAGTLDMAVSGSATAPTAVVSESIPPMVQIALDAAAQDARLAAAGLPPEAIAAVMAGVPFETVQATGSSSTAGQNVFVALAVGILLAISLGMYGNFVAQGVVEEKATRIMEILLATIRAVELLAGKIIGIGVVALLQLGIVTTVALITGALTHALSIPALGVVEIGSYLAWFLLGFLFYATAYAATAALVSRQEEVSNAIAPVSLLLGGSYLLMFFALSDPTAPWVTALSFVPPSAPIFMSLRIAEGTTEPWQVGLAMALTMASIGGLTWLAGRMYANAALRLGTRVRFGDAFRGL